MTIILYIVIVTIFMLEELKNIIRSKNDYSFHQINDFFLSVRLIFSPFLCLSTSSLQ